MGGEVGGTGVGSTLLSEAFLADPDQMFDSQARSNGPSPPSPVKLGAERAVCARGSAVCVSPRSLADLAEEVARKHFCKRPGCPAVHGGKWPPGAGDHVGKGEWRTSTKDDGRKEAGRVGSTL